MKPFVGWTKVAVMGVLSLQLCVAAFAQEAKREQGLGASPQSSPTGQTGAGTGSTGMAAAKPGQADGTGNPKLGGERRPLYRLTRSDVVTLSFTLSPELDQILPAHRSLEEENLGHEILQCSRRIEKAGFSRNDNLRDPSDCRRENDPAPHHRLHQH